jgi:hypothetical protein
MSALPELSSLSTALDELLRRLSGIADGLEGTERDDLTAELLEVERALGTAQRRLHRLLDSRRH